MTETSPSPVRASARALAFVVPLLVAVGLAGACADSRRALGDDCLKSQDCLSGICSQLHCAAPPPTTDTMANGPGADATVDAPVEASGEAAAGDGGTDAPPDSSEAGNTDAPPDSPGDSGGG